MSIPYPSGHPFLLPAKYRLNCLTKCVNPLSIGTPISTTKKSRDEAFESLCQSPIHRDTHFYMHISGSISSNQIVSIPYPSGHPFLLTISHWGLLKVFSGIVSIPYPSGHPFLLCHNANINFSFICVNPLSIGTPISTYPFYCCRFASLCVNPLSIGTPISTLV